jgi:hypothetical protein
VWSGKFEQTRKNKISQRGFDVLTGAQKLTGRNRRIKFFISSRAGRQSVFNVAVFRPDQAMAKPGLNMPANRMFQQAFFVAQLKADRPLIPEPDKQIHIGIGEPAFSSMLMVLAS